MESSLSETSDPLPSQPSEDQEQQTMSINRSTPESAFRASGKVSFSTPTPLIIPSIDRSTTESTHREIGHPVDLSSEHQSPPQLSQLAGGSNDSYLVKSPVDTGFQFFRHLSDSTVRPSAKRKLNDQSVAQSLPLSPSLVQSSDLSTGNSFYQSTNRLESVAQLTKTSCDESKADTSNDSSDDSPASPPAGQASNQPTLQSIAQQIYKATEPRFTFAFLNNSQLVDKQQMVLGADVVRFRQTPQDGSIYQTLVAMPEYIHISLDELRWQDVQLVDKWHLRSNLLKNSTIDQIPPVKHVPIISPLPADLVFGTGQACHLTETKSNNAPDHHSNNQRDIQTTFHEQTTSELKNVMDGLSQIIESTLQIACDRSVDIPVNPVINPFQNQSNDRVQHAEFHVQHGQTDIRVRVPVWRH